MVFKRSIIYIETIFKFIILLKGTSINQDHTLGTSYGQYLYFETDFFENYNKARIESPIFEPVDKDFCFEFWYFIDGSYFTTLNVVKKDTKSQNETSLWKIKGSQDSKWFRGSIPLDSLEPFSIILEGLSSFRFRL